MKIKRLLLFKKVVMYSLYGLITQVLLSGMLLASTVSHGQKVASVKEVSMDVSFKNENVKSAFKKIEQLTGYRFVFFEKDINNKLKLNASYNQDALYDILLDISRKTNLSFKQVNNNINVQRMHAHLANSRQHEAVSIVEDVELSGKITDENGQGLPGASILVKETSVGTTSDLDGNYKLTVPENAVVVVSFIGYITQEIPIGNKTVIDVVMMEDTETLNEVVVLGYTSKSQTQLASSVSVVKEKELNNVTTTSVSNALQGKAAGVFVTNSDGRAGSGPEVRIRGIGSADLDSSPLYVVDGVIGGIADPTDVESVTILKDAGATALYGSRASNGVIIITTKSGSSGETKFSYEATYGRSKPNFGKFEMMNAGQLYDFYELINPGGLDASIKNTDTDWIDLAFRDGIQNRQTLSASGGNDKTQFFVSGNYFNDQGVLVKDDYERYGLRANLKSQLSKTFHLTSNIAMRGTRGSRGNVSTYQAFTNTPFDSPFDSDGNPVNAKDPNVEWFGRDRNNFLYEDQYNKDNYKAFRVYTDLKLAVNITDWLTFTTSNRGEFNYNRGTSNADARTAAGEADNGSIYNNTDERIYFITSNILSASRDFGKHSLSVLAGHEYARQNYNGFNVRDINHVPGFSSSATQRPKTSGYGSSEWASLSYLSQVDYNYNNKYFATVSYRRDGSTKFGANNKYANFWSVGASWIVSNEDFFSSLSDKITSLKLRASYGRVGNSGISEYLQYGSWRFNYLPSGEVGIEASGRAPNPNLTWETSRPLDIGVDFTLFDRVDFQVDYYNKKTDGLVFNQQFESQLGYTHQYVNGGELKNSGWEFTVNSTNIDRAIRWTTSFNIAFNKATITKLTDGEERPLGNQRLAEGRSYGSWYMKKWLGVDPQTGDPLWEQIITDNEGNETGREQTTSYADANEQFIGKTALPDFIGGLTNELTYKGFSFSFQFNFVSGNTIYHNTRFYFDHDGTYTNFNLMQLADGWNRWEKPGDIATHPRPVYTGNKNSSLTSSRYLEDGSYLRLRNIRLEYTLPIEVVERIGLKNATVYTSADNLMTFTGFSGTDPEVGVSGTASFPYSVSKKLLFGVRIGF